MTIEDKEFQFSITVCNGNRVVMEYNFIASIGEAMMNFSYECRRGGSVYLHQGKRLVKSREVPDYE